MEKRDVFKINDDDDDDEVSMKNLINAQRNFLQSKQSQRHLLFSFSLSRDIIPF